ncbi:hypothetical protein BJ878DRAFT_93328 [Calycina marina]|uniref:Uncharacterized protein n=1 Tax=Calycina marina TaxID=1763456 RepID=A0A9P8CK06_9HELO|nr:hypothetical protein BJ878DRAFT_93328 [Calycina marina]
MSTWAPTVTLAPTVVVASAVTPVLTTTFSPTATSCLENRLTMLANRQYQIWMNEPLPVPGTTITDCYPSVYMNSFLNAAGGVTQPAFSPLVCPESYITQGPFTSNYIACCPSGYTLGLPTVNINKSRPAYGGTCYTPLPSGTAYKVIQYGADSVTATSTFAPSDTLAAAYAHPFEGFYFGVAVVASAGGSVTITNSEIAVMTGPSSSSTAAVATYTRGRKSCLQPGLPLGIDR